MDKTMEGYSQTQLRQLLAKHFGEEDLRTLCFDLEIDYDDLPGEGKASKARELVAHLGRRSRIPELITTAKKQIPRAEWHRIYFSEKDSETDEDREEHNQTIIDTYYAEMGEILEGGLRKSKEMNGVRDRARWLTIRILGDLGEDAKRKRSIVEHLHNNELIAGDRPLISLAAASLRYVSLKDLRLRRVNFAGAELPGSDLRNADLKEAIMPKANLTEANLRETSLRRARLMEAELVWADLTKADLSEADLAGADITGAKAVQATLVGTDLTRADLTDASLEGADLEDATLFRVILRGADLSGANLAGADLSGADLTRANLSNACLRNASLQDAELQGTVLDGVAPLAGQVMAGTGDVKEYLEMLNDGEIYRFEVVGSSMEHEDIYQGDYVLVKATNQWWPREGDTIITKYVPLQDRHVHIIGKDESIHQAELSGPTVKVYHEKTNDGVHLLGWKRSIKGHVPIVAKHILPIGQVMAVYPTSERRQSRQWEGLV